MAACLGAPTFAASSWPAGYAGATPGIRGKARAVPRLPEALLSGHFLASGDRNHFLNPSASAPGAQPRGPAKPPGDKGAPSPTPSMASLPHLEACFDHLYLSPERTGAPHPALPKWTLDAQFR